MKMMRTDNRLSRRQMIKTSLAAATILTSTSAVRAVTKVRKSPVRLGGPVFEKYEKTQVYTYSNYQKYFSGFLVI